MKFSHGIILHPRAGRYAACHLFFTSRLPDVLLAKIKASAAITRVASFKEVPTINSFIDLLMNN